MFLLNLMNSRATLVLCELLSTPKCLAGFHISFSQLTITKKMAAGTFYQNARRKHQEQMASKDASKDDTKSPNDEN